MVRLKSILLTLTALPLILAASASGEQVDYTGHKLVRVDVRTAADLQIRREISPDIWNERLGDARIPPDLMAELEASGLSFEILQGEFQPQGEQEQCHTDFRKKLNVMNIGDRHPTDMRPQQNAGQDVAQDQRQTQALQEEPTTKRRTDQ